MLDALCPTESVSSLRDFLPLRRTKTDALWTRKEGKKSHNHENMEKLLVLLKFMHSSQFATVLKVETTETVFHFQALV